MDRSKKLKHNCGKVLQLIFFSSSPDSAPLVAICPLFQWAIFPAAVGAVISPCCHLSMGCAAFPLFVFKFLFQHLLTGFLSCSSLEWPCHCMSSIRKLMALSPVVGWTFCSLNTSLMLHCPLTVGFPSPEWSPVCFHTFCLPQDWGSPRGPFPWWPVQGGRAGVQWAVFQRDLGQCWRLSWRTSSVSLSISWALTVQARSPLQ